MIRNRRPNEIKEIITTFENRVKKERESKVFTNIRDQIIIRKTITFKQTGTTVCSLTRVLNGIIQSKSETTTIRGN